MAAKAFIIKAKGEIFFFSPVYTSLRELLKSSISDISEIPRATVIRKLKSLEKKKHIIRNKKLEYSIGNNREHMKAIGENYKISQRSFSEYCTTMYNLMKFSKFSI